MLSYEYLRALDMIAEDIKNETRDESEPSEGLGLYWSKFKSAGREATLSNVNAAQIASYQDQLRNISLDVVVSLIKKGNLILIIKQEETVVRLAAVVSETNQKMEEIIVSQSTSKGGLYSP